MISPHPQPSPSTLPIMTDRGYWQPAQVRAGDLHIGDVISLRQGVIEAWWIVMGLITPGSAGQLQFPTVAGLAHGYDDLQPGEVLIVARNTRHDDIHHRYQAFDLVEIQAPDPKNVTT